MIKVKIIHIIYSESLQNTKRILVNNHDPFIPLKLGFRETGVFHSENW